MSCWGSDKKPLTEEMWADEKEATAYGKSKVMSEKAAWNFIKVSEQWGCDRGRRDSTMAVSASNCGRRRSYGVNLM